MRLKFRYQIEGFVPVAYVAHDSYAAVGGQKASQCCAHDVMRVDENDASGGHDRLIQPLSPLRQNRAPRCTSRRNGATSSLKGLVLLRAIRPTFVAHECSMQSAPTVARDSRSLWA